MSLIEPAAMPPERVRLTLGQFHALRDTRPKEEKWELIDGVPVMMAPPSLVHQRISGNIKTMINNRLAASNPDWRADMEIGVLVPDDDTFNPEPDVTVIDTAIELEQLYAERFHFVVEVLSKDKKPVLAAKMRYYRAHKFCLGVLFVEQKRVAAELHLRAGGWKACRLTQSSMRIVLPEIGDIGTLGDCYQYTPLFQAAR